MYESLPLPALTTTLQRHWSETFTPKVPTHFPGVPTPIGQQPAWVELWLDTLNTPPQRISGQHRMSILITVHCFSRDLANKIRAQQLADAAIATLAQRTLPVIQQQPDAAPQTIGWLSIQEPQVRDLSRTDETAQPNMQHLVISLYGTAQHC